MKLYIDTSNSDRVVIKLNGKEFVADTKIKKAQVLLPFLTEVLKAEVKKLKDIKTIDVHTGPGSYTGLRVGVSVANALGWALNLPVNGKRIKDNYFIKINYDFKD